MRYLFILLAFCLATSALAADRYIVRDSSGKRIETVEKSYSDRWIRRESAGKRIGMIEKGIGERMIPRDVAGTRTGTIELGINDCLVIRDNSGRTTHRIGQRYDSIIIRNVSDKVVSVNGKLRSFGK